MESGLVQRCVAGNRGTLCRKTYPGRSVNTEVSPLRFASVEMTKVKAALPWEGGLVQRCVAGNRGTVGMTKERATFV